MLIYRKSSVKPPLSNKRPPFQRGKVNKPPLSIKPPSPSPNTCSSQKKLTINVDWSVMVYS